jgi:hypothetical protein
MAPESSGAFFADILQRKKLSGTISGNQLILTGKLGVPVAARRFPLD